jgi:enoyl-[acyl-carrier-protein] reductase (NADH)
MTGRTALVTGGGLSGPAGGVGYAISRLGIAKAGIENLTKGAASLLGPRGIRVNCIQLGEIWTAMAARGLPEGARARRRLGVALQTEGTCWDAAYAALFLASDRARWISGHILTMDGGGPYRTTMAGLPAADTAGPPEAGLATAVPR